tara:strand:+ start:48 stop:1196 length:1149 start_codon:yes stop_codon:yes gene_type:complete
MIKIATISSTRADFGLLKNLIKKLNKNNFKTRLIATGTHFSKQYGYTYRDILNNKIKIDKKINKKIDTSNSIGISKIMSAHIFESSKIFEKLKPDLIILLGDRYEILASAIAAHICCIPIAHIHGGELTNGLIDDAFRHSITKLSQIHFVANKIYKKRVIQLGENPKKVFDVGGMGVDSIKATSTFSKAELEKILNIKFSEKNLLINFHPETLNKNSAKIQTQELLSALKNLKKTSLFFTMPGAENENLDIIKQIKKFVKKNDDSYFFKSLGHKKYFSFLKVVDGMIGNSSSGLLEMPSFRKATINLGNRQSGRIKSKSVLDTKIKKKNIIFSIKKIYSKKFINKIKNCKNPYGDGGSSNKIVKVLKKIKIKNLVNKKFYDI